MDLMGGNRYHEIIKTHYNTDHPVEAYRPEYLGGSSTPINITPVAQSSKTDGANYLGKLGGYGTAVDTNSGFVKSFSEFCLVIGIVNVRADITYQEGMWRLHNLSDRYDLPWPVLAHMGQRDFGSGIILSD